VWSVIIASAFFILAMYAEILGLRGSNPPFDQLIAPLATLSDMMSVGYLKVPILIGAICSSFSVALACVNTCARIALPMAENRILPRSLGAIHPRFETPHVALAYTVGVMFFIGLAMYEWHVKPIDIFNYCGTLSSLSFITVYLLITIAAPKFLKRIGELRFIDSVVAVVSALCLIGAAITLFYPAPPPPTNLFPYVFLAYLAVGLVLYYLARSRAAASDAS
jgi:amino acid transporter